MARDGSGNFSLAEAPFTAGTTIESAKVNSDLSDIAAGLTQSMSKDGQTTPTANQPMGGYKHTGVGAAASRTEYLRADQYIDGGLVFDEDEGTADVYSITLTPGITAYTEGSSFFVKIAHANATTTPTFAVNGLTAGTIVWPNGSALAAGDLPANACVELFCAAVSTGTPTWHLFTLTIPPLRKASNLSDVASVATARVNLQIDQRRAVADASVTALLSDTYIGYTSISTARAVTLPAASTVDAGHILEIADESGSASASKTISVAPNGTDTIDGSNTTQVCINIPGGSAIFVCNGSSKWTPLKWSVVYTTVLGSDVTLDDTSVYKDGPSVAQGTVGRWRAYGTVGLQDSSGSASRMIVKLWDGTTVIASGQTSIATTAVGTNMSLSGYIASPAGNLRLSVKDATTTSGAIAYNASGNSKDSFITVERLA